MSTIVTRTGKGSILTVAEMDANLNNLNSDVTIAFKYKGVLDASGGVYPSTPVQGDTYVVSVTGTISAVLYSVDDVLFYNGAAWKRIFSGKGLSVDSSGHFGVGITPATTAKWYTVSTASAASIEEYCGYFKLSAANTTGASTKVALLGTAVASAGSTTNALVGIRGDAYQDAAIATAQLIGVSARAYTLAAGTVSQMYGSKALIANAGAATVTDTYGYFMPDHTVGTNNYGFYSNMASAANKYNFYANGTADNYFGGSVGIGAVPYAGANFVLSKSITGNISSYAQVIAPTVNSDVTIGANGVTTFISTQAASFTLATLAHFTAGQNTIGAGSTVTSQYGFNSANSLVGATTNVGFLASNTAAVTAGKTAYGFYSAVNTASGGGTTWGFYGAGTAANYFAGRTYFNTSIVEKKSAPTISTGTLTLDLSSSALFAVSLNAAVTTLTLSNPPAASGLCTFILEFTADGTPRSVTWPASVKWSGSTAPTLTSTSAKKDAFALYTYDGGTTYIASVIGQNF